MKKKELVRQYLNSGFSSEQAWAEIDFLCSVLFGLSQKDLILNDNLPDELEQIVLERVSTRRPVQQTVGRAYFMGQKFFVNSSTLIPRPETELLVLKCAEIIKQIEAKTVLDIGTGSGCIPISVSKLVPSVALCAVDISQQALKVAQKNAEYFGVRDKIDFITSDLFENVEGRFDIIVSNPPYICPKMYETLEKEVKDFEPESALLAHDELGIEFYEKIVQNAPKYLNDYGYLIFEIGFNQAGAVKNLLENAGFKDIVVEKDLDKKDRIVYAKKY